MKTYLVGGAVRDELLGVPGRERDWVVVGATPAEMLAEGFKPVGRHFPVFIHPASGEEYALARTERKTAPGYHGFEFDASPRITLEQDLKRRDLTVNAVARDSDGKLIDPWGGVNDLKARKLRHISEAFGEDPVRVLRVARFAAKLHGFGFSVVDETLALMRRMVGGGETDHLVAERVWLETEKTLQGENPSRFFAVLDKAGALQRVFPEISRVAPDDMRTLDRSAPQHGPEVLFTMLAGAARRNGQSLLTLCRRLKLPRRYHRLARMTARAAAKLAHAEHAPAAEILQWIEQNDALRRGRDFDIFLTASLLNAQLTPAGGDRLRRALAVLEKIDFKKQLDPATPKGEIRARIRAIRLAALKDI